MRTMVLTMLAPCACALTVARCCPAVSGSAITCFNSSSADACENSCRVLGSQQRSVRLLRGVALLFMYIYYMPCPDDVRQ